MVGNSNKKELSMIKAHSVTKIYDSCAEKVVAIDHVSFSIRKGENVVFAGASGSGKTTLLNLIGTLDSVSEGHLYIEGCDLSTMSEKDRTIFRRKKLGFIFQNYSLVPVLTAQENVELALKPFTKDQIEKMGIKDIHQSAKNVLEAVGLHGLEDRKPYYLSGGQQQRVSIARALVKNPSLILADEPTANLDSKNSIGVLNLLKQLNQQLGVTIICSSHDQDVLSFSARIITLADGKIIGDSI